ncbi:nitrogen permease regulator of amino acid transport activity 3-domain-containing protein [Pilobolus umbonatus]|nr:nitrogen permease regulator of amino acid transport activity 3-domain-containing protein [Pilobolus umbonatus]
MEEILHKSSLARDIKSIYTAISADTPAHVIINDFIDLSLQIPVLGKNNISEYNQQMDSFHSKDVHHGSSLMDIYGASGYEYDNYPVLCPYHTLLLLEDPEEVLKNMPLDASPTLVQLVQILTPTQSTRNIYVVSPTARLNEISSLEADFKLHVPNLSLPVLLSKLSRAQQYHQVYGLKELKNQYLEAITYLIRKDLVVQLHMYLVVLTLVERKQGTETPQSQQDPNTIDTTDNIASSPTTNTLTNDTEWNRLKRSTYERAPKEISDLFDRLKEYMDGQHHIEEIIYREGVSRRQLGLVLKYYRDKIVTVYHY